MVFYIRDRQGWERFLAFDEKAEPVWVEQNVLSEAELLAFRDAGMNLTNFTVSATVEPDVDTVRMHHPDEVIWVQF